MVLPAHTEVPACEEVTFTWDPAGGASAGELADYGAPSGTRWPPRPTGEHVVGAPIALT